jgi:hypothetical protein
MNILRNAKSNLSGLGLILSIICAGSAHALVDVRWTDKDDADASFEHVVSVLNARSGEKYTADDFRLFEATRLATSSFETYFQMADGVPVRARSLRIWKDPTSGKTIQVEAYLENKVQLNVWKLAHSRNGLRTNQIVARMSSQDTMSAVRAVVKAHRDDRLITKVDWKDYWSEGELFRYVKVKGRKGTHSIVVKLSNQQVVEKSYEEFPQSDLPVKIYSIYEESEGTNKMQERVDSVLRNLSDTIPQVSGDPFASLRSRKYMEDKYDPVLGMIPAFQEMGYWSAVDLKFKALNLIASLPQVANDFATGFRIQGKYATVSIHPDAAKKFSGINFEMQMSPQFKAVWAPNSEGGGPWEYIPSGSLYGRPAYSAEELLNRPARRLAEHSAAEYINDGFDEIQVYWAVDRLFSELQAMGFTDPELSTRPFNAFLYDPEIGYQDNAYYTDDTINFTTYSAKSQNMARDNPTIWHELGHGVMDRLMGDYVTLADTGGLQEGMADFVAQLVIQRVSGGVPFEGSDQFRIINNIGFHLTNEVHDDGEAYGGTMNDLLLNAITKFGRDGVVKVTDLTMEAMRLARNHPHLTAQDWFNHMMYADDIPSSVRQAGELKAVLIASLEGRNYRFDDKAPANMTLRNGENEVTDRTPGSRGAPISYELKAEDTITHHLSVQLKGTDTYKFVYPVKVKVQLEGGPLQGAINWVGQENRVVEYTMKDESELVKFDLTAKGVCERANREDGSCVDFAYVQIWNAGETTKPVAKKRFYLRIKTK